MNVSTHLKSLQSAVRPFNGARHVAQRVATDQVQLPPGNQLAPGGAVSAMSFRGPAFWHCPGLLGLALLGVLLLAPALAGTLEQCRDLRQRRDALAAEAMAAEIVLAQELRERLCPELNRQAEGSNANDQVFVPIDYEALRLCRRRAEQLIERTRPVRYRSRVAFTFYTTAGAVLAEKADAVAGEMQEQSCP